MFSKFEMHEAFLVYKIKNFAKTPTKQHLFHISDLINKIWMMKSGMRTIRISSRTEAKLS